MLMDCVSCNAQILHIHKKPRGLNLFFFVWLWLVCVWRVRPVNEIKRKWLAIVFSYRKDKTWVMIVFLFFFFVDTALKTRHIFWKLSLNIKINCLGIFYVQRFFGENFQAPHQQRFHFCDSSLFLATLTFTWHPLCNILHMLRSEKQTCSHTIVIIYIKKKDK